MSTILMPTTLIGIDVGGTFTDFVLLQNGQLRVFKEATTPDDQSRGIVAGLRKLGILSAGEEAAPARPEIVHGTTVATNALLERQGARTALLTTAGFIDVIEIGRQNRPHLYALHQQRPEQLAPAALRFEASERLDCTGRVLLPLDENALHKTAAAIAAAQPESLAICFLYSFHNPAHEQRAAEILRQHCPGLPLSLSSQILPEYREYERTATTVINAYVRPLVSRYLDRLTDALPGIPVRVMQSNGGAIGTEQAGQEPARLVLSGPAGGVVGAFRLAQLAAEIQAETEQNGPESAAKIITFDMGGTSTDVALCPGAIPRSAESEIAGLPLRLPILDIHTVGAGGGSLARVDPAGGLRVGPESAGAVPGPVAYGRGGSQPTVTDANLALGRLDASQFLGGSDALSLDVAAAEDALAKLGQQLGGLSVPAAALGVIRVANATMERALRRVSVERGHDPREFALVPFGGAGPLHACDLAQALGIRHILLPPSPGVLSALGLLMADVVHESSQALLQDAAELTADASPAQAALENLRAKARAVLAGEGIQQPVLEAALDLRYRGQSYELTVPLGQPATGEAVAQAVADFHRAHAARYGYAMDAEPVEVVTLRLRARGQGAQPTLPRQSPGPADPSAARVGTKPVWFQAGAPDECACYARDRLRPGHHFPGPAVVFQFDTTTVVAPGWSARVDGLHNLWLARSQA